MPLTLVSLSSSNRMANVFCDVRPRILMHKYRRFRGNASSIFREGNLLIFLRRYLTARLHGVISQKTIISTVASASTSDLMKSYSFLKLWVAQ